MILIPQILLLKKENTKTRTRIQYSFPFAALYSSHSQLLPYDSEQSLHSKRDHTNYMRQTQMLKQQFLYWKQHCSSCRTESKYLIILGTTRKEEKSQSEKQNKRLRSTSYPSRPGLVGWYIFLNPSFLAAEAVVSPIHATALSHCLDAVRLAHTLSNNPAEGKRNEKGERE